MSVKYANEVRVKFRQALLQCRGYDKVWYQKQYQLFPNGSCGILSIFVEKNSQESIAYNSCVKDKTQATMMSVEDTNSEGVPRSEEDSLPLVSAPRTVVKRNPGFIKKGSTKFVAAIKSLHCSPRVEEPGDYGKLQENRKAKGSSHHALDDSPEQQHNNILEEPIFVANFDNFDSMQNNPSHGVVEQGSISKNLELEKVLVKLDSRSFDTGAQSVNDHENDLEIFTTDTDETNSTIDNGREIAENEKEYDDDIKIYDHDIIDLRNISRRMSQISPPSSPTPSSLIKNEFSQYSNDSNDTPVTCNKSLILTPKMDHLHYLRDEERMEDENDFGCLPPKEVLHHNLSLGDSLSPTEEDSPCKPPDQRASADASKAGSIEASKSKAVTPNILPRIGPARQQQGLETLKLPVMNGGRRRRDSPSAADIVLNRVQQFEKQLTGFSKTAAPGRTANPVAAKMPSQPQDDDSGISSTVSSFVFSVDSGQSTLDGKAKPAVVTPEHPTSPGFFWKTRPPCIEEEKEMEPPTVRCSSFGHPSPAFFWKTHPRVTIKSYHFQQRKSSIRRVNTQLESGRSMHHRIA